MRHIKELERRWQIRFRDERKKPQEVTFSFDKEIFSRRQVEKERDRLRYLWQRGEWDPWSGRLPGQVEERAPVTLRGAVDAYVAHKKTLGERRQKGGWSPKTVKVYRDALGQLATEAGPNRLVHDLATGDLEKWIFAPPSEATQATRRRMVGTFLKWASAEFSFTAPEQPRPFVERRTIPPMVTEAICAGYAKLLHERAARPQTPKGGERDPLKQLWMPDAWRLAFYQGLRLDELRMLRCGGVDLDRKRMIVGDETFVPKGKDERVITVTPPARPILARHLEGRAPTALVFPRPRWVSLRFSEAAELVLPGRKVHFHSLRHSACVYWLEAGVPMRDVRDLLRHKSLRTTEGYMQVVVEGQTDRFEQAFGRAGGEAPGKIS